MLCFMRWRYKCFVKCKKITYIKSCYKHILCVYVFIYTYIACFPLKKISISTTSYKDLFHSSRYPFFRPVFSLSSM